MSFQRDVELWLNNDYNDYFHYRELVTVHADTEDADYPYREAAEQLQNAVTNDLTEGVTGLALDLLYGALSEVDWEDVAETLYPRDDFPENDSEDA